LREVVERESGGRVGEAGLFDDTDDVVEGGGVLCDVGEIDDGEVVAGDLDHEIGEAAGAAGVEK
jgi:hypothetical protein